MNVISRAAIIEAKRRHPRCREWLDAWGTTARHVEWTDLASVRQTYPFADHVERLLVFNAPEAKRLIVGVRYANPHQRRGGTLFIKHFLTHAEYDRGQWKER